MSSATLGEAEEEDTAGAASDGAADRPRRLAEVVVAVLVDGDGDSHEVVHTSSLLRTTLRRLRRRVRSVPASPPQSALSLLYPNGPLLAMPSSSMLLLPSARSLARVLDDRLGGVHEGSDEVGEASDEGVTMVVASCRNLRVLSEGIDEARQGWLFDGQLTW